MLVLPHIDITWVLHWSTHETAHINHCLATHWYYMGSTLVGPWNCTWKATVFPQIGIAWGLYWSTHESAHKKTLSCHTPEFPMLYPRGAHVGFWMASPCPRSPWSPSWGPWVLALWVVKRHLPFDAQMMLFTPNICHWSVLRMIKCVNGE